MCNDDWTGYTVIIPGQHNVIITGPWKKDKPDMWWWKCSDCTDGSGVMSAIELEKLNSKNMVIPPEPETELPPEHSRHPKEGMQFSDEDYYYGYGF